METLLRILIESESQEERVAMAQAIDQNFALLAQRDKVFMMIAVGMGVFLFGLCIYLSWRVDRLERRLGEGGQLRQAA